MLLSCKQTKIMKIERCKQKRIRKTGIKSAKGFSLVEVLISLTLLTLGISSISLLMANNIRNSQNAKDEVIAAALAQEGIELVRNFKDNYTDFSTKIVASNTSIDYAIYPTMTFSAFLDTNGAHRNDDGAKKLYFSNASGIYRSFALGLSSTKFSRKLRLSVTTVGGKKETKVTSIVSWKNSIPVFPFSVGNDASNCTFANKCLSSVSVVYDNE